MQAGCVCRSAGRLLAARASASCVSSPPVFGAETLTAAARRQRRLPSARHSSSYAVSPFGRLVFRGAGGADVAPLSALQCPDMDRCTVECTAGDAAGWTVSAAGDTCSVTSNQATADPHTSWKIRLPIKYDVDIQCEGTGSVCVSGMESAAVSVQSCGLVSLSGVRAGSISAHTSDSIKLSKSVLGSVELEAQTITSCESSGLQGQRVSVSAQRSCQLTDVYADSAAISVGTAELRTGTLHADSTIDIQGTGQAVIGGVDGSVQISAPAASVRLHIHRLDGDSSVRCGGEVRLTLDETVSCLLEARAPELSVDPRLSVFGQTQPEQGVFLCQVGRGSDPPRLTITSPHPVLVTPGSWAAAVLWGD